MADETVANSYEEARRRRVQGIKKRFEEMGIRERLMDLKKPNKSPTSLSYRQCRVAYKWIYDSSTEPRRSSRARNPVASYNSGRPSQKRLNMAGTWSGSLAGPVDGVRVASNEERAEAIQIAHEIQQNLRSSYPTFVKSLTPYLAYFGYQVGVPRVFRDTHLPCTRLDLVLEDEKGKEYRATLAGKYLRCGWKLFALEHKLDDGDALVFELIGPTRLKVYIVRAGHQQGGIMKQDETKKFNGRDSKRMVKLKTEPALAGKGESNMSKKQKIEAVRRSTRSTRSSNK